MEQSCIPPLCELLTVMDSKIVQVALNGLENILRLGEQDAKMHGGTNPYAVLIEECYGEFAFVNIFIRKHLLFQPIKYPTTAFFLFF